MKAQGDLVKDDIKTEIKGLMLRHQLDKKMLNIHIEAIRKE